MKAYVCVYRQLRPHEKDRRATEQAAAKDLHLGKFLETYEQGFYDWGDDPSFFAAKYLLNDVRQATWGVCRRDVRSSLNRGDVIIFFCAREDKDKTWSYYFIGFGTVGEIVSDRNDLWNKPKYAKFHKFYNLLIDRNGNQCEQFRPLHKDWVKRSKAFYVLFDSDRSVFNLDSPHRVATWDRTTNKELWNSSPRSQKIERLIFKDRGVERRLRTSRLGFAHPKLNLTKSKDIRGRTLLQLTEELKKLI